MHVHHLSLMHVVHYLRGVSLDHLNLNLRPGLLFLISLFHDLCLFIKDSIHTLFVYSFYITKYLLKCLNFT